MASGIYNRFKANVMNKVVDMEADTINVSLYNNTHSFTAADTVYTSTNELATTGGYTQGGQALDNKAVTEGATIKWDANDEAWTSATFTAYHCVVWDATAANNLIASFDFGGAQQVTAATFTIQWHADGIITLA